MTKTSTVTRILAALVVAFVLWGLVSVSRSAPTDVYAGGTTTSESAIGGLGKRRK